MNSNFKNISLVETYRNIVPNKSQQLIKYNDILNIITVKIAHGVKNNYIRPNGYYYINCLVKIITLAQMTTAQKCTTYKLRCN